jgi:WS/DGAT/MGAT family acyltransferase
MEQLSGTDALFVAMENSRVHAHTGGLTILDPSSCEDFSFEKLKRYTAERIRRAPRFTMRLREVPLGLDRPFLVEDLDFDIENHFHRIGVPSPGSMRELGQLCGMLFSHKLDRRLPLWEMWYIEGLEGGRVAMFSKTHHCLIDGVSGAGLSELMCDLEPHPPEPAPTPRAPRRRRRPEPSDLELIARGAANVMATPFRLVSYARQAIGRGLEMRKHLQGENAPPMIEGAPAVSFNENIGPRRGFACSSVPLENVKAIKKHFDVKVNDVVLELVGSAVRRYLRAQGELPKESLVVLVPISTRRADDSSMGNQVAQMSVSWATNIDDPAERLLQIHQNALKSKEMDSAVRAKSIASMGETAPPAIINSAVRLYASTYSSKRFPVPGNAVVSNVPGPPIPLYTAGARIEAMYPMSLLLPGQGLNVTCISYGGRMDFGFTVDPDLVPDPWYLAEGVPLAVEELQQAIEAGARRPAASGPKRKKKTSTEPDEVSASA